MALIGRLFAILFGFLAACLVAGMIVVAAVLFPEFSDFASGPIDPSALNIVLGFGFVFVSGFALLPAMIVVAITEAFYIRGVLTYAVGGGVVGLACYLGLIPFDPATLSFDGIVRRHLEIMTGAGIVAGSILRHHPEVRPLGRVSKDELREKDELHESWPSFEARKGSHLPSERKRAHPGMTTASSALFISNLLG